MYGITDLFTFVLGTIFIVLLPGPNSLYVMAAASRWGVRAGYQGAAGIFVGDTVLMLLAVTGMASVLRATPELFMVIKYAGAAYLAWVGLGCCAARWRPGGAGTRRRTRSATASPTIRRCAARRTPSAPRC